MARKLEVQIVGDASSAKRAFDSAGRSSNKLGGALKGGLFVAAGAAAGAIAGLGVAAKIGFDEFNEAQKVAAQTGAVLKSTGGAAKVTAQEVSGLAESLMRKSGVDDEAIQSGENMLLTFTKIRNETGKGNDIFNQATKATLDLSVAMGKDMQGAAILVGKALNDPIKGMSALSKAGIQFTAEQKKTITSLVESGHSMDAQKMILKELETQFGGSAAAAGKTFSGQIDIAKNVLSNFAGEVVGKVMPTVANLATGLADKLPGAIDKVTSVIRAVGPTVREVVGTLKAWGVELMDRLRPSVLAVVTTVTANWPKIRQAVQDLVEFFKKNALPIWDELARIVGIAVGRIVEVFRKNEPQIREIISGIKTILQGLYTVLREVVLPIVEFLFTQVLPRALNIAIIALAKILHPIDTVKDAFAKMREIAGNAVDRVAAFFRGLPARIGEGLKALPAVLASALQAAAAGAVEAAIALGGKIVQGILSGLADLPGRLKDVVSNAVGSALQSVDIPGFSPPKEAAAKAVGKPIADGIIEGFLDGIVGLPTGISDKVRAALDAGKLAVDAQRGRLAAAFSQLAGDALEAFDARTAVGLSKIEAQFDRARARLEKKLRIRVGRLEAAREAETPAERALREFEAQGREETPAERALREFDAQRTAERERLEMERAQAALREAEASGNEQAIADARARIHELELNRRAQELRAQAEQEREAGDAERERRAQELRVQAEQERAARNAEFERQRLAAEKEAADDIAAAEKRKGRQTLDYQAQRDLRRRHLEADLLQLSEWLNKHPGQYAKVHKRIMTMFREDFGPGFKTAAKNLGNAFAKGLDESDDAVAAAARRLAKRLDQILDIDVRVTVAAAGGPSGGPVPGGVSGTLGDEIAIGRGMGLVLSSGYRPGDPGDHGKGKAIDMSGGTGAMAAYAQAMFGRAGSKDVIYGGLSFWQDNGRMVAGWAGNEALRSDHFDHVHFSEFDNGGKLMPGWTLALNRTGVPEQVIAPGRGGGGVTTVNVYVEGFVGDEDKLADRVHRALLRKQGRNVTLGLS